MKSTTNLISALILIAALGLSGCRVFKPESEIQQKKKVVDEQQERIKRTEESVKVAQNKRGLAIPTQQEKAIPFLIDILRNSLNAKERREAAKKLRSYGLAAKEAVPTLLEAMKDPDGGVRGSATYTLGKVGAASPEALSALLEALDGEDLYIHEWAVNALGDIGPKAKDAVPKLIEILQDEDERLRYRNGAKHALNKIGTAEALSAVIQYEQNLASETSN